MLMGGRPGPGAGWSPVQFCCCIAHGFIIGLFIENRNIPVVIWGWLVAAGCFGWPMGLNIWMESSADLPLKAALHPGLLALASRWVLVVIWR